jgi:hypothetical protein
MPLDNSFKSPNDENKIFDWKEVAINTTMKTTNNFDDGVGGVWRSSPWAIQYNNKIYFTHFSGIREIGERKYYDIYAYEYDLNSKLLNKAYVDYNPEGKSTIASPIIILDKNNYFHLFYGAYYSELYHQKSKNPLDVTSWADFGNIAEIDDATYPTSIVLEDGTVLIFYRAVNALAYISSADDKAETWNKEKILFKFSGRFIYPAFFYYDKINSDEAIYFVLVDTDSPKTRSQANIYFGYFNAADGNVYCPDKNKWINLGNNITNQTIVEKYCYVDRGAYPKGFVKVDDTFHLIYPQGGGGEDGGKKVKSAYFNSINWTYYTFPKQIMAEYIYQKDNQIKALTNNESGTFLFNFNGDGWELDKLSAISSPIGVYDRFFSRTDKILFHKDEGIYLYDLSEDEYLNRIINVYANVYLSDDGKSIKANKILHLSNGSNSYDISDLGGSRYIKINFSTEEDWSESNIKDKYVVFKN